MICKLIVERLKEHWYVAWLVTLYTFMFGFLNMIYPMSIEVASAVGIAVCHMGFALTVYIFVCDIIEYIITRHKSKGKKGGEDE